MNHSKSTDLASIQEQLVLHRKNVFEKLFNDVSFSDVRFKVGSGKDTKIFYGVRSLFAAQSIVFRNMLLGRMKESSIKYNYRRHITEK